MGHKHSRQEILEAAVATAFADGLSQVTYGRVAKRLGISDRTVVYYFPTKDDLVGDVLVELAARLLATVAPALGSTVAGHRALVRTVWPVLAHADADAVFALFFEASGLAAAGRSPFRDLVPQLVEGWIGWAAERLRGEPERRRAEAEAAIALLDGLLLMRQVVGPAAAATAAQRLGVA